MTYFLDLFAGIGGFRLGAECAGLHFDGHYFSEVDPYAIKVYSLRFPDSIPLGDIRAIRGADLPKGDWIIAGGFPCQDISVAGKGAGLAGERSGLWYEYARLIGELRPRFAIMENVGALAFRGLDSVLGSLAALGYDAEWQDIRASDVGAPHRRERLWIVAYPSDSECATGAEKPGELRAMLANWREHDNADGSGTDVSDSDEIMRNRSGGTRNGRIESTDSSETMADAASDGREPRRAECSGFKGQAGAVGSGASMADAKDGGNVRRDGQLGAAQGEVRGHHRSAADGRREWWATEPALGCLVDGLPYGLDRFEGRTCKTMPERVNQLKCLGNSIVPQIAELIFSSPIFDDFS